MRLPRQTSLGIGILVAVALAGVALLGRLPPEMAIHFGTGGDPDTFVGAPVGVVLLPAIGVAVLVATRLFPEATTGRALPPSFDPVLATFLGYVQALVLAYNLGVRVDVVTALLPALAAFAVALVVLRR